MTSRDYFERVRTILETAYTAHEEPWRQSGMSGPYERWEALRRPVAECVQHSGSFLDIGCANGYLLECLLAWTAERGLRIDPHGLDISEKLLAFARARLPDHAHQLYLGNAFTWGPPRRFDFVRTELVYVPDGLEADYIGRLLAEFVNPGGRLLIAGYSEGLPVRQLKLVEGANRSSYLLPHLEELGFPADGYRDGYDPVKDRRTRIAWINKA
jgi:SAM-dependent methyltransferase